MRPQTTVRGPWYRLAGWSITFSSVSAVLFAAGVDSLSTVWPGVLFFPFAAVPLYMALRVLCSGIFVYADRVLVRGITGTRRMSRSEIDGVGYRRDSLAKKGAVCVGVRLEGGDLIAPATLSTRRGSAEANYLVYQLTSVLPVPLIEGA